MPVLVRSRGTFAPDGTPLNPAGQPILVVTLRRRKCANCQRPARVTIWSPSTAFMSAAAGAPAAMAAALAGLPRPPAPPVSDGQCCIRCTRELTS